MTTPTPADGLPAPAERGATVIPDKVVARIAARAAQEALTRQTGGPLSRRQLGAPRSRATAHDGRARLGLLLDLPYPVDIIGASQQVRDYVAERVTRLTGIHVTEVTLTVRHLVPSVSPSQGRVR